MEKITKKSTRRFFKSQGLIEGHMLRKAKGKKIKQSPLGSIWGSTFKIFEKDPSIKKEIFEAAFGDARFKERIIKKIRAPKRSTACCCMRGSTILPI